MVILYEYTRTVCTIRVRYEIRVRYTTGTLQQAKEVELNIEAQGTTIWSRAARHFYIERLYINIPQ